MAKKKIDKSLKGAIKRKTKKNIYELLNDAKIPIFNPDAKQGGVRVGAGRNPILDKKIAVTIYVKESKIKEFNGMETLKIRLIDYIDLY